MSRLKISDLSFCEVATDQDIEIEGGLRAVGLTVRNLSTLPTNLFSLPVNYTREQVYSGVEYTVENLNNPNTGASGYLVSSNNGRSLYLLLTGRNTNLRISVSSYSLARQISESVV